MTTSFPSSQSTPESHASEVYRRGLSGDSDVYVVKSGPNAEGNWKAGIPLFLVETDQGEEPDMARVEEYIARTSNGSHDPQVPEQITHEQLAEKLEGIERLLGGQAFRPL